MRNGSGYQGRDSDRRPPSAEGRVAPHDLDAEAAVISAVLLERSALDEVLETLRAEHFYSEANRRIYEAACELAEKGTPIDVVTVARWLRDAGRFDQMGGVAYLNQIADSVPAVAHVAAYATIVREKWRLRQLIATCQRVAAEGYAEVADVQEFVDHAEQSVYDIARTNSASAVQPVREVVETVFKQLEAQLKRGDKITGLSTGFDRLDGMTAGLHPGELTIVAARPGMGKTSLVLNIAAHVAQPREVVSEQGGERTEQLGAGVIVFSLEMPREQLGSRMLCSEASVDVSKMRSGHLQARDWQALTRAASDLARRPMWIDDTPALGLLELRAKVRRLQGDRRGPGVGLVVVDYLQLMQGRQGASSREQEISEISRGLKGLSKELSVPVIALSQLNRAVETRATKDKRPQLSDLRESGAIEQDADNIIFIYREDYYDRDDAEKRGLAELIVAKQRNGPTGKVRVRFTASCTRFDNLAPEEYERLGGDD